MNPDNSSATVDSVVRCIVYAEAYPDATASMPIRALFVIIYVAIFVLGLVGNAAVVQVTITNQSLQTVQNILILNLAVADILVCLLSVPFTPIMNVYKNWYFGDAMCHIIPWVQGVSIFISTYSLSVIAIDRCRLILRPTARHFSTNNAWTAIAVFWTLSAIIAVPYAINMEHQEKHPVFCGEFCQENWSAGHKNGYSAVVFVLQMVIPFGVMAVCYAAIFIKLKRRTRKRLERLKTQEILLSRPQQTSVFSNSPNRHKTTTTTIMSRASLAPRMDSPTASLMERRSICSYTFSLAVDTRNGNGRRSTSAVEDDGPSATTAVQMVTGGSQEAKMSLRNQTLKTELHRQRRRNTLILVGMVLIFAISWLPQNAVSLVIEYDPQAFQVGATDYMYLVLTATHSFAMINIVLNPVLYAWLNESFRQTVVKTLRRVAGRSRFLARLLTQHHHNRMENSRGGTTRHCEPPTPQQSPPLVHGGRLDMNHIIANEACATAIPNNVDQPSPREEDAML